VIMPYIVVFVFGYESWVGRLIAGAYIWAVAFLIICIFVVFAPSERLITPEGKLRHLKSDTPRRVVEVIARTLGAGIAIFAIGPEAGWIDGGLFSFLSSPRSDRPKLQVSYSPSVQNYSFD
jgi:hypothetical protein